MDNTCFLCDKSFSTASNLRRHARLTQNVEKKVSTSRQIKCNVCSEELVSVKALLDHVEWAHNIAIEKKTKKFDTYEAFKIWKEDVEKQTVLYEKNTGNDKREGFPAAFILSNRQDSKALSLAFLAIKEYVSISPKIFMMDDTESFPITWGTIFGVPEKKTVVHVAFGQKLEEKYYKIN
ncbi:c2H2-type domain-containing protein [Nephila pilipes]|uniref:C2H2-type domain-containing protein n=1 Tax=Nephila pilipes TaxID=299642 RepID=A0A8X6N2E6_NEPPI|nr:c2H2-type domain-containing protein [Nephila pilipes]